MLVAWMGGALLVASEALVEAPKGPEAEKGAGDFYRRVSQKGSDYAGAWYRQGNVHALNGEYEEAIECYLKALEIQPHHVNALNNLGNAYLAKRQFKLALERYERALALDPKDDVAWGNRGIAHGCQGEYSKAVECFKRSLDLNMGSVKVMGNLGITYLNMGDRERAGKCFRRVLDLDPNDEVARSCLARLKEKEAAPINLLQRLFG
jgi:tetratricopeptide (TPR) repeat protein